MWCNISPRRLAHLLAARRRSIYIAFTSLFTMLCVSLLTYTTLRLSIFTMEWSLLWVVLGFSVLGLWSPILISQSVRGRSLRTIVTRAMLVLCVIMLGGLWFISWPTDLIAPLTLTAVLLVVIASYYLHRYSGTLRTRAVDLCESVRTSTIPWRTKITASIRRVRR